MKPITIGAEQVFPAFQNGSGVGNNGIIPKRCPPCMQYTDDTWRSTQVFFIFCKGEQRRCGCIKKQLIQKLSMAHDEAIQLVLLFIDYFKDNGS